jgi:4-hydroxybenzoate polyprenyltransferase
VLESLLLFLTRRPFSFWWIGIWLLRGKAVLGRELMARELPDFAALPVNPDFLAFLKRQRDEGRILVLATPYDMRTAAAMAEPFDLFASLVTGGPVADGAYAGISGLLQERFGAQQYDYAEGGKGDTAARLAARKVILVTASGGIGPDAQAVPGRESISSEPRPHWRDWATALRLYQWPKNLLLLAPLMFAHAWNDTTKMAALALALAGFCLCASSVYILNDLLDLAADRHHPAKRHRPFAAGKIPLGFGLLAAPLLLIASCLVVARLPVAFWLSFALYYGLTLGYSLRLKQIAILDVLLLAGLYSLRVIAGGLAVQIHVTDWLLAFSLFLFLSLAFVKRFTELQGARDANQNQAVGRGYLTSDIHLVSSMGVSCGYLSVLVLAFYINNPAVARLYQRPDALWLACPVLLYWISRIWLLAHRQRLHEDPVVFTLKDWQSWLVGLIFLLIAAAAAPV